MILSRGEVALVRERLRRLSAGEVALIREGLGKSIAPWALVSDVDVAGPYAVCAGHILLLATIGFSDLFQKQVGSATGKRLRRVLRDDILRAFGEQVRAGKNICSMCLHGLELRLIEVIPGLKPIDIQAIEAEASA